MPVLYETRPTLVPPPTTPEHRAPIENILELTHLKDIDPDLYTNTRPLWHPPGARGIYGGAVIAQCLAAGQHTVAKNFYVHSMHCYFVMAGDAKMPIIYHVEHVREGRSFAVRTVQARQRGKVIFTTTMSFVKEGSGGKKLVEHAYDMPLVPGPTEDPEDTRLPQGSQSPFISQQIDIFNNDSPKPHTKRTRQWIKARGKISEAGGHEAHLAAMAYMSDSYFIGTISRVHKLWRIPRPMPREQKDRAPWEENSANEQKKPDIVEDEDVLATIRKAGVEKMRELASQKKIVPQVGMMVSLDHTIYFHNPKALKADEWLFTEMESPWAGDGRGLVMQRIWTRDGTLVASCVQEGVVRLKPDSEAGSKL
ncbi:acyl-CoA thioesterase II [Verruconis gallopava]|uniref:Acyl-CoA thioesterase II n=1 Tax=Verruconis gallopava TaxID=253628 RepID=A0A0D1YW16_9PEZI|nr:acyl-CoA thioesterase II [Verruconis gallopava]KIW04887.1 acyl-CoA thioesterase II [Verruconis gallopava]